MILLQPIFIVHVKKSCPSHNPISTIMISKSKSLDLILPENVMIAMVDTLKCWIGGFWRQGT